jgi:formamidopyrimidine-DNA glycosylase
MPELPEVETMRRGIATVVGCVVTAVERARCKKKPIAIEPAAAVWRRRVVGQAITGTARAGKRVVVELESSDRIVFEPRMTGLVLVADPPGPEHLRLTLRLAGGAAHELLYWDRRGLGLVTLYTADEYAARFGEANLGPDALVIGADELRARLGKSRRAIKVALLDQRAVAGIGNLYASEILHLAGIHPAKSCNRLLRQEWHAMHAAMLEVLELAIRYEGSTLADGTYRNALNQTGGYQNHHRVYDKAGALCRRCRSGQIRRVVQAQRSTFFCPVCQPLRRPATAGKVLQR